MPVHVGYSIEEIPESLYLWLHHEHALTDKLGSITGETDLILLSQHWRAASWWDQYVLDIHEKILERTILMTSKEDTYWFARSIIPNACYQMDKKFFKRLEHESIKNLIYGEPRVNQIQRHVYSINSQNIEYHWIKDFVTQNVSPLWARLTEFSFLEKHPFFIIEILFPIIQEL